jgi:hypothetical protein
MFYQNNTLLGLTCAYEPLSFAKRDAACRLSTHIIKDLDKLFIARASEAILTKVVLSIVFMIELAAKFLQNLPLIVKMRHGRTFAMLVFASLVASSLSLLLFVYFCKHT